ncbi:MAG: sigma-54-dependent Fis family transcriptional regulator [Deltaproteobacteria bacterium]|nr:sigma-54-dependent Fis family transcriptional regulator [Deltaproteobacteria bacterium]MBW2022713.1 sigma-54-dependent Fis family transcriptional regulator [Deltaproteobacteria bacterium]
MAEIAVVDDERVLVDSLELELEGRGHTVRAFYRAAPFLDYIQSSEPDVVLLDLKLPDFNGLEVLERIKQTHRFIPTVIITAHGNLDSAIRAMRGGAFDYVNKPFDLDEIEIIIDKALKEIKLVREVEHHRRRAAQGVRPEDFIGSSPPVQRLMETVKKLSRVDNTTVLLRGESGTGKNLLAKMIHNLSARSERQLIEVNCASIPETLLESELFGYEKGAFTDAKSRKTGLVELADAGTLFLDEVGDLPLSLQAKLLRFLESRSFRRIGGTTEIRVDVLIISSTNRDLEKAVAQKRFREDLYYRLNVVPLDVPPLRERGEDILALAEHYLAHFSRKFRKPLVRMSPDARAAFLVYHWPGNVRELKNLIERMVILSTDNIITYEDLPTVMKQAWTRRDSGGRQVLSREEGLEAKLAAYERMLINEALERTGGIKSEAAKLLGVSRYSLLRKIKRLFDE